MRAHTQCTLPIEHGIEGGNFIDAHRWHLQHLGHMVHHRQRAESRILTLGQVEQGNDGSLLVLRRVLGNDVGGKLLVGRVECKRDGGVVDGRVPVLEGSAEPECASTSSMR